MPDIAAKNAAARQVEMFIRRLGSLSTFPQVAAAAFQLLCEKPIRIDKITELVESDPALTVCVLSLAAREGLALNGSTGRIDKAIQGLPIEKLREAILAVPLCSDPPAREVHDLLARTDRCQLTSHALAVACAARKLAQAALPEELCPMAFAAGLLHDLGKLALVEVMPRSFAKLVKQAQLEGISLARAEQQHLGMDHTRIGKQLAEKWNLPEPIRAGIWLHHSDPGMLMDRFPSANVAQVVRLANLLAKRAGLGDTEDPYAGEQIRTAAYSLKISMEVIERIENELADEVRAKCALVGIRPAQTEPDVPTPPIEDYYQSVQTAASVLARENLSLSSLAASFRQTKEQMELTETFLSGLGHPLTFEHIVASMVAAVYGRGQSACAMVLPLEDESSGLYCHLMDRQGRQFVKLVYPEAGERLYPETSGDPSEFRKAPAHLDWLFEKLEQKLDVTTTHCLPLSTAGRPSGLLLVELAEPAEVSQASAAYRMLCKVATSLIACAAQTEQQKGLSEQMVELFGTMQETGYRKTQQEILDGVAEMAAGAAHELNNPLSVISGRVQQLQASEPDPQRKELLELVQTKADEMALIVKDLAEYARPRVPEKKIVSIDEILVAVMHLLSKQNAAMLSHIKAAHVESLADVYVDQAQVAQAIYHVLINALQSYPQGAGPVRIEPAAHQISGFSALTIADDGVGIDPQVLAQVFEPFYSHKPAGRRRGMGLAHARRLITLNGGSIRIESHLNQGTRVTIQLPGI